MFESSESDPLEENDWELWFDITELGTFSLADVFLIGERLRDGDGDTRFLIFLEAEGSGERRDPDLWSS